METRRKPLIGVINIIRFNARFYLVVISILLLLFFTGINIYSKYQIIVWLLFFSILIMLSVSLIVSAYIYDFSELYTLPWLSKPLHGRSMNIHAGFDETSVILKDRFSCNDLVICDFYDPENCTEPSIRKARQYFPPLKDTMSVSINKLDMKSESFDTILVFFSAHEIRDPAKRLLFFKELCRLLTPKGKIYVTEHVRNWKNFLVYNIGCLHFFSDKMWQKTFLEASLTHSSSIKTTPFVNTYILKKNGDSF